MHESWWGHSLVFKCSVCVYEDVKHGPTHGRLLEVILFFNMLLIGDSVLSFSQDWEDDSKSFGMQV